MKKTKNRWTPPPADFKLAPSEAHLWRVGLDIPPSRQSSFWDILSDDEKQRANRFRFEKDKRRYIAGRAVLRNLLAQYLNKKPAEIHFRYGPQGKPFSENGLSLKFNLSNSAHLALIGFVLNDELGVDLEDAGREVETTLVAKHFFSKKETERLLALPAHQQQTAFYNCWTRKEAFIKAKGDGLSFPLDQFEVSLRPNEKAELLATYWDEKEKEKWSLFSVAPMDGFVGALAVEGKIKKVKYWDWEKNIGPVK
ncbi:MAG TPA: 4'-phosphopantetheinyl transferase superfamily protein [Bacteroidetes bacterium]|nr:4'-phosphopantetheinyl transferase superfamily protein [Bacteroidota bacterium]